MFFYRGRLGAPYSADNTVVLGVSVSRRRCRSVARYADDTVIFDGEIKSVFLFLF